MFPSARFVVWNRFYQIGIQRPDIFTSMKEAVRALFCSPPPKH